MESDEALLSNYTVPELQQECKKRGLKKSGIKIKLIQRLAEHIGKYGPDKVLPPAHKSGKNKETATTPVEETSIEKSVNTIHNPHPYMAEYEEQLIEGANMESDIDDYYSKKDNLSRESSSKSSSKEVTNEDYIETSINEEEPDSYTDAPSPEIPQQRESPIRDTNNFSNPGDTNYDTNDDRDPRDISEEFTEPIHQSPTVEDHDRIVELPVDEGHEDMNREDIDHEDIDREDIDREDIDREDIDHEDMEREDINHEDEHHEDVQHEDIHHEDMPYEDMQDDDLHPAIMHHEDIEHDDSDHNAADYAVPEQHENAVEDAAEKDTEEQMERNFEENEEMYMDAREDVDEGMEEEGMEEVKEEVIADALHAENDTEDVEETEEPLDYADADDDNDTSEMQYNEDHAMKDDEGEEQVENEKNIGEDEDSMINENDSKDIINDEENGEEGEVTKSEDEGEVEAHESGDDEEEGEITANAEQQQNNFEENNVGGDDHLDVSIQDDKITEDSEPDEPVGTPKPPKKTVVPVSLKKRVSLVASTESQEEKTARRKRRWGATNTLMKDSAAPISSESIKKLIPNMKIDAAALESVPELDYQEDDTVEETLEIIPSSEDVEVVSGTPPPPKVTKVGRTVKVDTAKKITLNKSTSQEIVTVESDSGEAPKPPDNPPSQSQSFRTYMIDDEVEIQEQREKSPSPARNPIAQYIFIEDLVRPYTINQLKSVIRRTGEVCEGGFWINNIKSRCYVKLSNEEQATATRDALHGLKWPAGSPKILKVDYAVNEQLFTETEGLLGEKPKIVIEIEDKENEPIIISQDRVFDSSRRERKDSERSRLRSERKKRLTKEPEKVKEKEKRDDEREESPAKLLDDLFRKTKATPCIYWLPLTEEQIVEKEKHAGQNRSLNESNNDRPYDYSRDRMEQPSIDRYSDRRSQQFRSANRSWR